jgi:hypothetical protein
MGVKYFNHLYSPPFSVLFSFSVAFHSVSLTHWCLPQIEILKSLEKKKEISSFEISVNDYSG